MIIKEGDSGDLFYIIKEGFVVCYKNKIEKRQLGKGDYFGEQALIHSTPRTATVIAGSDIVLVSIGRDCLVSVLGDQLETILYHNSILIAIDKSLILKSLNSSQVDSLISCAKISSFSSGQIVIPQGTNKLTKLVIVLKGSIQGPNGDCGVHHIIGDSEIANKDNSDYNKDFIAVTSTDIAEITLTDYEKLLGGSIHQVSLSNEAESVLKKVQLFKGLSENKVKLLTSALKLFHYEDKEIIVQQNTIGNSFFMIKSGVVSVYKNEEYVRDIGKNDYFGERAILFDEVRTAKVVSNGPVDC